MSLRFEMQEKCTETDQLHQELAQCQAQLQRALVGLHIKIL